MAGRDYRDAEDIWEEGVRYGCSPCVEGANDNNTEREPGKRPVAKATNPAYGAQHRGRGTCCGT